MICIIDYDAGNVKSVLKAFRYLGEDVILSRDPAVIFEADHVVLPGVGNFGDAVDKIDEYGLRDVIAEVVSRGTPFLGICVGLQLLFDGSEESPGARGLHLLTGFNSRFKKEDGCKIPQIGWNSIHFKKESRLFRTAARSRRSDGTVFILRRKAGSLRMFRMALSSISCIPITLQGLMRLMYPQSRHMGRHFPPRSRRERP